jgi:hypothetical protein
MTATRREGDLLRSSNGAEDFDDVHCTGHRCTNRRQFGGAVNACSVSISTLRGQSGALTCTSTTRMGWPRRIRRGRCRLGVATTLRRHTTFS